MNKKEKKPKILMKNTKVFTLPLDGDSLAYSPYYSFPDTLSPPTSSSSDRTVSSSQSTGKCKRKVRSSGSLTTIPSRKGMKRTSGLLQQAGGSQNLPFFVQRASIESSSSTAPLALGRTPGRASTLSLLFPPSGLGDRPTREVSLPYCKRSCNDRFFLCLLVVAIAISWYFLANAMTHANPALVLNGHDDWGNICGQNNRPIEGAVWSGQNMTGRKYQLLRLGRNYTMNSICIEHCTFNDYFKTAFNRCLPKPLLLKPMFSMFNVTKGFFDQILVDTLLCWQEVFHLCLIAVGMSFFMLITLRFFVGFIIWLIIFILGFLLCLFTLYFWSNWTIENNLPVPLEESALSSEIRSYDNLRTDQSDQAWLWLSLLSSFLTFIFVLLVLWLRKSIQLVSLLFREAGKATSSMPFLLLLPFLTLSALAAACFYLALSTVYMEASVRPVVHENSTLVLFEPYQVQQYVKWYNFIIFVWVVHLIYACQHFIIASCVAKWYFRSEESVCCPILHSSYQLFRYHLGSLALGSLLLTGVKIFRIFLKKIESTIQKYEQSRTFCFKILRFIVWLFERLMVYINKNAYILIAIYGTSFNKAASGAFKLVLSNSSRVAVVNTLGDFLLFISKMVIVASTFLLGVEWIKPRQEQLNYAWGPLLIPVLFAYFIAHCFLTVYEMAIDTLFVCFCESRGLHDPSIDPMNWGQLRPSKKNTRK